MLRHPCILGDPQRQLRGAKKGLWSQTMRNKIRTGCLTHAFSRAQKRAEMLRHPSILGDPQHQAQRAKYQLWCQKKGNKIRSGCLTHASSSTKRGQKRYVSLAFSGIPNANRREKKMGRVRDKGEQNQNWLPHPCLLKGPKEGGNATSALHSRASPTPSAGSNKSVVVPNKGEQNQKWLPHPGLLGAQKRAEMLHHPCIVGDPRRQRRGAKN